MCRLRAVSFAISRPWQKDDAQASRLLLEAINAARLVRGARIEIEPFEAPGPDDSRKAQEFASRGLAIPRFRMAEAPADLRALFVAERDRWMAPATAGSEWNESWSHPHVCQPLDYYRGKCVAYSLGNLIFPEELNRLGEGAWLSADFNSSGGLTRVELLRFR